MLQPDDVGVGHRLRGDQRLLRVVPGHLLRVLYFQFHRRIDLIRHHALHPAGVEVLFLLLGAVLDPDLLLLVLALYQALFLDALSVLLLLGLNHVAEEAGVLVVAKQVGLADFPHVLLGLDFSLRHLLAVVGLAT